MCSVAIAGDGIVIIGAGGHGREVLDVLEAGTADGRDLGPFLGFLDDGHPDPDLLRRRHVSHLGPVRILETLSAQYLLGIGDGRARRSLDAVCTEWGREPAEAIHPLASFGANNEWGPGLVVCSHSCITTNVRLGRHVHVNVHATVSHDCVVGDYVTISPGSHISGNVTLGDGVLVGIGATIVQGVTIGTGTIIGAGAVVISDLPEAVTAVGVPARPIIRG